MYNYNKFKSNMRLNKFKAKSNVFMACQWNILEKPKCVSRYRWKHLENIQLQMYRQTSENNFHMCLCEALSMHVNKTSVDVVVRQESIGIDDMASWGIPLDYHTNLVICAAAWVRWAMDTTTDVSPGHSFMATRAASRHIATTWLSTSTKHNLGALKLRWHLWLRAPCLDRLAKFVLLM